MCGGEDGTIHYGEDIGFVVSKSVATHQQDEVAYQQCGNEIRDVTVFHGQRNNSGSTVAKGQALHDTQDTDAVESPDGCPELFAEAETFMGACPVVTESGEPADGKSDQEDDNSTLQYLHGGCMTELEIVLLQGDIGRDTHDEHEEGEDEVGGGEAIPLGVA